MTSRTPRFYDTLPLASLDGVSGIAQPPAASHKLTLDSPSVRLLTDFTAQRAQTILTSNTTDQALNVMKQAGVRLLMVIGPDGRFTGVVNARELVGGRKITIAMQQHDVPREEVTVDMIQTPRAQLHSLSLEQLENARVGDLVETLKAFGDQHVLITAVDDGKTIIRGLVSASDISRALGIDLEHPPEARSFAAICQVILGHDL